MQRRLCLAVAIGIVLGGCNIIGLIVCGVDAAKRASPLEADRTNETGTLRVGNMRIDQRSGYPVSIYNINFVPQAATVEDAAMEYLLSHDSLLGITSIDDIEVAKILQTPGGAHVRLQQRYRGLAVKHGTIVVSMNRNNVVTN